MNKIQEANKQFALRENWALENTIQSMIEKGYMDNQFNALNGLAQETVDKMFQAMLEHFKRLDLKRSYEPHESSFKGQQIARKLFLKELK